MPLHSGLSACSIAWVEGLCPGQSCHTAASRQVRAVVTYDKAVVLKSRRDSENQGIIAPMLRVGRNP